MITILICFTSKPDIVVRSGNYPVHIFFFLFFFSFYSPALLCVNFPRNINVVTPELSNGGRKDIALTRVPLGLGALTCSSCTVVFPATLSLSLSLPPSLSLSLFLFFCSLSVRLTLSFLISIYLFTYLF